MIRIFYTGGTGAEVETAVTLGSIRDNMISVGVLNQRNICIRDDLVEVKRRDSKDMEAREDATGDTPDTRETVETIYSMERTEFIVPHEYNPQIGLYSC